jgi:uncharacterized protein (TIGR00266 family)
MKYEIQHDGENAILAVELSQGETFKAVAGALMSKTSTVTTSGTLDGGPLKALKRSLLGGEKFFFQTVGATADGAALMSPPFPGDIVILPIDEGEELFINRGCFLAAFGEIDLETVIQKATRALLTGEGLFVLRATGKGALAISAFGGVRTHKVEPQSDYIVDNGHLIAWRSHDGFSIEKSSDGWISSFASGEGLLWRFPGPADLWLQTRNPHAFSQWMKHLTPSG